VVDIKDETRHFVSTKFRNIFHVNFDQKSFDFRKPLPYNYDVAERKGYILCKNKNERGKKKLW